jgi:hypothetical protein
MVEKIVLQDLIGETGIEGFENLTRNKNVLKWKVAYICCYMQTYLDVLKTILPQY